MKRIALCWLGLCVALPAVAEPWVFGDKIVLAKSDRPKTFHHIDSAGRKHIAVAGDTVAVVWEDNHSGVPQVYVAFKPLNAPGFGPAWRVSDALPRAHRVAAFEPVIVALADGRFLMGWEQGGDVWLRTGGPPGLDPALKLSTAEAGQVTLAAGKHGVYAAWAQRSGRYRQIVTARIDIRTVGKAPVARAARPVEALAPGGEQLYPTLAVTSKGITIVWEDRRHGHTVLLTSFAEPGKPFGAATELNEIIQKSSTYGRGSGVTRAALATYGTDQVGAVWMDKRGFRTGYDIYAAVSSDGGRSFGKNEMVQDAFGENISQWHPAVAGGTDGMLAVAWDDDRDGSSDIMLSWQTEGGWSDDYAVPAASGAGQQTNPAIALDRHGNIHLVWVESAERGEPTTVVYAMGQSAASSAGR